MTSLSELPHLREDNYTTRTGVLNSLNGWIDALRWQRLPEMDRLGEFLFNHVEGIAAYCDHPVRFGVVESINTTIKAVLRRARGMRNEAMLCCERYHLPPFASHMQLRAGDSSQERVVLPLCPSCPLW
jgi:hypothetical protein